MISGVALGDRFHDSINAGYGGFRYGGAFCAIADDPSAVFYNPAGIVQQVAADDLDPQSLTIARSGHYRIRQKATDQADLSLSSVNEAFFAPTYLGGSVELFERSYVYALTVSDYVKRQDRIREEIPQTRNERPEISYRRDDQFIQAGVGTAWAKEDSALGLAVILGYANYETEIIRKGQLSIEGFGSVAPSGLTWQESSSQERLVVLTLHPGIITTKGATTLGAAFETSTVVQGSRRTFNDSSAQPSGLAQETVTSYSPTQPARVRLGWAQKFSNTTLSTDVSLKTSQEYLGEFEDTRWTRPSGNVNLGLAFGGSHPKYTVALFTDLSNHPIDSDLDRLREDSIDLYGIVTSMRLVLGKRAYMGGLEARYGRSIRDANELLRGDEPVADKVVVTLAIGSEGRVTP